MGRQGLNKIQQELYSSWELCRKVCRGKGQRYEGVPLQKEWETFDGFYKDNYQRYFRARRKWKNYMRVAARPKDGMTGKLKHRPVRLVRKIKEKGFTKGNTCFSSPSDIMKYHSGKHRYMFENKLLGTRDIKNILKKRGVLIEMESITQRLRLGQSLFEPSVRYPANWKGCYRSYAEVAKMEKISYDLLKKRIFKDGMSFLQALKSCREYKYIK